MTIHYQRQVIERQTNAAVKLLSRVHLCDPMNCSTPGFLVLHYLSEFTQIHVHQASDAIEPSHLLPSPSPFAFNLSQHPVVGLEGFKHNSAGRVMDTGSPRKGERSLRHSGPTATAEATYRRPACITSFLIYPRAWRRRLRVPWTARRSNQSILKEISPEYSLEGLMLKLQYFGHLM